MESRSTNIRRMTMTAMLSAISFILMFLEFGVPFMPSFIKLDFSELPVLVGSFALGPVSGVMIALIKNLLHLLVTQSGGVGELSNFILSCAFVLPAGLVYKYKKNRVTALIGSVLGAVLSALVSIPSNYFIVYPVYEAFMPLETILEMYKAIRPSTDSLLEALIVFNAPFTFLKDMVSVIFTFIIYKHISPLLKGNIKNK